MEISAVVDSVLSLFIMILIGVYGSKKKIISSDMNKLLTDILIQIALPFMIVSSFIFTYDDSIKTNVVNTFYYSLISYLAMALISMPFVDLSKTTTTVIIMTAMPASAMTSIFAESYDKEKEYAAVLVSVTTLLSLITVPLLLKIII